MPTLTIQHLVRTVKEEIIETPIEIPAYFKDIVGSVYAIAEDKRIVQVSSMRRYYSLTIFEPGDDQYEFKLKECSKTFAQTTEEHFFSQLARLKKMLP